MGFGVCFGENLTVEGLDEDNFKNWRYLYLDLLWWQIPTREPCYLLGFVLKSTFIKICWSTNFLVLRKVLAAGSVKKGDERLVTSQKHFINSIINSCLQKITILKRFNLF